MKEQTLKSWEEFEEKIVEINQCAKVLQQKGKLSGMECPLFRGHSDSAWHLESTLDRIQKEMSYSRYLKIIKVVREHVATCTGKKWDLETNEPKMHLGGFDLPLLTYEFMAYLRHNGFPSPLIDWTESPYIAAFFAFRDIYSGACHKKDDVFAAECPVFRDTCSTVKYVSIFAYRGKINPGGNPSVPSMRILGPSIKTSRTHYLQQSWYSICFRKENKEIYFANHEDVKEDVEDQGSLIKYNIPASEREKVLKKLDSMNITAYSLFGSESSLMETLALRELFLK